MSRKIKFWGLKEDEDLHCKTIEERVLDYWDAVDVMPDTLELIGYAPVKIDIGSLADYILDKALIHLDQEYSDPALNEGPEPTKNMKKAAMRFAKTILREYDVWPCEPVCKRIVPTNPIIGDRK